MTNNQTISMPLALAQNAVLSSAPVGNNSASIKGALIFNGPISGPFGLTTTGKNYVQFNGTNSYSGDTTIASSGGDIYISIGSDRAFGTGRVKFGPYSYASQLWATPSGGDRVVTNDVDILTVLFIAHNATVAGKAPGGLTLSGNVRVLPTSGFYVKANSLTLSGTVSGGGSAANVFELRAGKLNLWGNNTFTNTLIVTYPGYGAARVLNINSDASLGHINNGVRLQTSATLQLPVSTNVVLAPSRMINITSNYVATFDIPSGASLTLNGPVTNSGAVVKSNSGTLTLAGVNSYSGGTTLWGGALEVNNDASLGALPAVPSTNLRFAASSTLRAVANHTLAANRTLAIDANVAATFEPQGFTQTVCGVISGGAGSRLVKTGTGTVALDPGADRTNSVWSLSAKAGTLKLNVSNTLWTGGSLWVASNAVFDVNGKSQTLAELAGSGTVINNGQLSVTAGVAPGTTNMIGTLTLASSPAALGGDFRVDVAADGACDRLHVQGDLDLTGLNVAVSNPETLNKFARYVIASCEGTLTGPFLSEALPSRWQLSYNAAAREVLLRYDFGTLMLLN